MTCSFCGVVAPEGMHFGTCEFHLLAQRVKVLEHDRDEMEKRLKSLEAAYLGLADRLGMGGPWRR